MEEYLVRIKALVDSLALVGDHVPDQQHIDVKLEGLPQDFTFVISMIKSKFDSMQLKEVKALLLAHKMRFNKYKKLSQIDVIASVNLTQANSQTETDVSNVKVTEQAVDGAHFSFLTRGGYVGGHGVGRGRGRFTSIQCQVRFKYGHVDINCYHIFNQQFEPNIHAYFQTMNLRNFYNPFPGSQTQNLLSMSLMLLKT